MPTELRQFNIAKRHGFDAAERREVLFLTLVSLVPCLLQVWIEFKFAGAFCPSAILG
jgi:hypothetical protein